MKITFLLICTATFTSSCIKADLKDLDYQTLNAKFSTDIFPIIQSNCLTSGCHNTGSSNGDLTTYDNKKGRVNSDSLEKRVLKKQDMPTNNPLSLDDRKKIKCWIKNGSHNNSNQTIVFHLT